MTEDDTFRKLKRLSWNEVYNLVIRKHNGLGLIYYKSDLEKYDWTCEEFKEHFDKRNNVIMVL